MIAMSCDRVVGGDGLLVLLGKRLGVVLGLYLPDRTRPDRSEQPVAPGARRLGEQVLDAWRLRSEVSMISGRVSSGSLTVKCTTAQGDSLTRAV